LFAYFIQKDVQNVLRLLASNPWVTGIILWCGFDAWSFTFWSSLVLE